MAEQDTDRKANDIATVSIDAARDALGDLVARADYAGSRTIITRYGKDAAALVSMTDLEKLRSLDKDAA